MYDLVVLGCGPVGAVAANVAGRAGLRTLVLDKAPGIFARPRAIHFDAHIMRILQDVGLADAALPELRVWKQSTFFGADGKPIRVHTWPAGQPQGWDQHYLFYQPVLEGLLRDGLQRFDSVELRTATEAVGVRQDAHGVHVRIRGVGTGDEEEITAVYLLAADGASSFARRSSGIALLDGDFNEPWLVVDLRGPVATDRPDESEMFCDPARPATRVPGPGDHHRWEFMLLPGESVEQAQDPAFLARLLSPWVEMDQVEVLRASVYRFHSLIAERWRDGRVLLAGDAAHQTPPFLGQGMCHGIRDVHSVVLKLAAVLAGGPAEALLDSYEAERRPQVEQIVAMSVAAGRDICLLDPVQAAERDRRMRTAARTDNLPRTTFQGMPGLSGGLFPDLPGAGELSPQPWVVDEAGRRRRLDDAVGPGPVLVLRAAGLTDDLKAVVEHYGVSVAVVGRPQPGRRTGGWQPTGVLTVDDGAALEAWFDRVGGRFAVVRPDRYVMGVGSSAAHARHLLQRTYRYYPRQLVNGHRGAA